MDELRCGMEVPMRNKGVDTMKKYCSKCGKELKNGMICISMKDKTDLCSECGMIEALEFHGISDPDKELKEIAEANEE